MRAVPYLMMLTAVALTTATLACHAEQRGRPARATISEIDDLNRAKLDVQETKLAREQLEMEQEMNNNEPDANGSPQCGTVSIGNTNNSNNAVNNVAPHNTTVIVDGNVFNTANCGH